jgi:hypothetical protein
LKIISFFLAVSFVGFAVLQLNDEKWLIWSIAYLFSAYTAACSVKNYYNPMLLMMMVTAYLIASIGNLPEHFFMDLLQGVSSSESSLMSRIAGGDLQVTAGMFFCALCNAWYMFIGFGKAKKPGYNADYSVSPRREQAL